MTTESIRKTGSQATKWYRLDLALIWPIFGSHVKRIGFWRVLAGAGSMYLSMPLFIIFHVTGLVVLYRLIIFPLFGLKIKPFNNYIILDRHKIEGLAWLDKFNCLFCGYANGLCVYMNESLDDLNNLKIPLSGWRYALFFLTTLAYSPIAFIVQFLGITIIFDILVSRPLGMHRRSSVEVSQYLCSKNYAANFPGLVGRMIRFQKNFGLRLSNGLEQIESSWCPLKHLDKRMEAVYPVHHEKFFTSEQIEEMKEVLQKDGTVSVKKPTW